MSHFSQGRKSKNLTPVVYYIEKYGVLSYSKRLVCKRHCHHRCQKISYYVLSTYYCLLLIVASRGKKKSLDKAWYKVLQVSLFNAYLGLDQKSRHNNFCESNLSFSLFLVSIWEKPCIVAIPICTTNTIHTTISIIRWDQCRILKIAWKKARVWVFLDFT